MLLHEQVVVSIRIDIEELGSRHVESAEKRIRVCVAVRLVYLEGSDHTPDGHFAGGPFGPCTRFCTGATGEERSRQRAEKQEKKGEQTGTVHPGSQRAVVSSRWAPMPVGYCSTSMTFTMSNVFASITTTDPLGESLSSRWYRGVNAAFRLLLDT